MLDIAPVLVTVAADQYLVLVMVGTATAACAAGNTAPSCLKTSCCLRSRLFVAWAFFGEYTF